MIDVFTEMFSLKQADLLNKTNFDNKLTSLNTKITSNKIKLFRTSKRAKQSNNKRLQYFIGQNLLYK